MSVRIVETLGSDEDSARIEAYLVGLADLGWIEDLYVKGPEGEVSHLVHGSDPASFESLERALEGRTINGVEITTVAVLPVRGIGSYSSARQIVGLGADGRESQVGSSLILCPSSALDDDVDWWTSISGIDRIGEVWDRRVILSPEDRTKPDEFAQRVGPDSVHASAAAAAAVLSGAVDPAITVSSLPPSNADEYRVVRLFARSADMEGVVRQLVSAILDQGRPVYDGQALAIVSEHPQREVSDARERFVVSHNLSYRAPSLAPTKMELGLWAAIKMLLSYIGSGLSRLPKQLISQARAKAISKLEGAVTKVVLGKDSESSSLVLKLGGPGQPRAISPENLDLGLSDLRSRFVAEVDPSTIDKWLPELDPVPEPEVWKHLPVECLSLLDGGTDDRHRPVLDDDAYGAPEPLSALAQSSVLSVMVNAPAAVQLDLHQLTIGNEIPLALATSDPWRLDALIELIQKIPDRKTESRLPPPVGSSAADNVESAGDESADDAPTTGDTVANEPAETSSAIGESNAGAGDVATALTRLRFARRQAEQSFLYGVGATILQSLDRATQSLVQRLESLSSEEDQSTWTDKPERRVKFRLKLIFALLFIGITAAIVGGVLGVLGAIVLGAIIAGLVSFSATAMIFAAVRYQRDVFRREHMIRRRQQLFDAARSDWSDIHRFNTLYRQFRQWSSITAAEIHRPVGRPGEIVVFGAQQTKPRWLLTARSMAVEPGEVERIRRATFQRGWRNLAFSETMRVVLESFTVNNGLNDTPEPEMDVRDRFGSRRHIVGEFARTNAAAAIKRRLLEGRVGEHLVRPEGGLVDPDEITEVVGRYHTVFDSLGGFFGLGENDHFSAYVFTGDSGLDRSDHGNPRDLEDSVLSVPAAVRADAADSDSDTTSVPSLREWPRLTAVRMDSSYKMTLDPPVIDLTDSDNRLGGGQSPDIESATKSEDDEEITW